MDPAMGAGNRTRRFRRDDEDGTLEGGFGFLPEAPASPVRPGVGTAAISGMNHVAVSATASFAAPAAEEALSRSIAARPRKDVIERIKSNSKTHGGTARPGGEARAHAGSAKPNETADSWPRPLDPETLQEEAIPHEETARSAPATRAFAPQYGRDDASSVRRSNPLQRVPDLAARRSDEVPQDATMTFEPAAAEAVPDLALPVRRAEPARAGASPVALAVVFTLLVALLGGVIAMVASAS